MVQIPFPAVLRIIWRTREQFWKGVSVSIELTSKLFLYSPVIYDDNENWCKIDKLTPDLVSFSGRSIIS